MGQTAALPDHAEPRPSLDRVDARDRTQDRAGAGFRGEPAQESTGPSSSPWPGRRSKANGLPRGARLRSERDGRVNRRVTTREGIRTDGRRAHARRWSGLSCRREPASRLRSRSPGPRPDGWATSWRAGESGRETPECVAPAAVDHEPQGSKRPARAGTAPREGKALQGVSQGRERHGTRPRSVGASRRAADLARVRARRERSQNRREGQEP
jgi:hypothetical protein